MNKILLSVLAIAVLAVGGIALGSSLNTKKLNFISGTEYMQTEAGSTIVRVTNQLGIPVTATGCNVTIWYPNKTLFVSNTPMTQGGTLGSWFNNWVAPSTSGNYEEYVNCSVSGRIIGAGSSFHVSDALTALYNTTQEPVARILS